MSDQQHDGSAVTWAGLLAGCVEFAQTSVALPENETGERWRHSVTPIITLHAITHALGEFARIIPEDRAKAIDLAHHQIRKAITRIHEVWGDEAIPDPIHEIIEDVKLAIGQAETVSNAWVVAADELRARHPADVATMLLSAGFTGDLFLPAPGIPVFEGTPAGFIRSAVPGEPVEDEFIDMAGCFLGEHEGVVDRLAEVMPAMQVYRQFDFAAGRAVRDLVAPLDGEVHAGQPLLVPVILSGEMQAVALPPRRAVQLEPLPLEFVGEDEA